MCIRDSHGNDDSCVRLRLRRLRRRTTVRAPGRVGLPVRIRAGLTLWRTVRLLAVGRRLLAVALRLLHVAGRLLPIRGLRPVPALLRRLLVRRLLSGYRRPVGRLLAGSRRWGVRRLLPVRGLRCGPGVGSSTVRGLLRLLRRDALRGVRAGPRLLAHGIPLVAGRRNCIEGVARSPGNRRVTPRVLASDAARSAARTAAPAPAERPGLLPMS